MPKDAPSPPIQPRARGTARVSARLRDGASVLGDLRQSGSMRVLFPRPSSPPTAMLLNTAGGITGGDQFQIEGAAEEGAQLTLTTQAAERVYRATPGQVGRVTNTLTLGANARLNWLPQETILFDGSNMERHLTIDVDPKAELLMIEPLVFGRAAHGEVLRDVRLRDHVRITSAGRVIYADGIALDGDVATHLAHPAVAGGTGAMASLVYAGPRAAAFLPMIRSKIAEISGSHAGGSLLNENLLLMRALAHDSFELRRLLLPVLDEMTDGALPICWRL